jgi:hypothetical protein
MKAIFKVSSITRTKDKVTGIRLTPSAEEKNYRDEAGNDSSIMIIGKALEAFPNGLTEVLQKTFEITIKEIK